MRAVAFGAHPDDVELYAGGLVAGWARRGVEVTLVDLTAGELGTRGSVETRAAEAAEAARILGVKREGLRLPDGKLSAEDPAQLAAVVEALRRHRPDVILGPGPRDPHPDHAAACLLIRKARFLARLAKWPAAGEPCRPGPVLLYEQKTPFEPDLIVDVSADQETKRRAIAAYGSQFRREAGDAAKTEISEPAFHAMLEARSRVHGYRIGAEWGEGYQREEVEAVFDPTILIPGSAA
ncbi:MAG: bacillithiol biosynthesis deacetylase BshB1 [bacterium]